MAEEPKTKSSGKVSRRTFLKQAGASAAAAAVATIYRPEGAIGAPPDAKPNAVLEPGIVERLGPGPSRIELKINGRALSAEIEPRATLLDFLRDHVQLTGPKLVCDRGACGACTIHLDGKPMTACMILAVEARGHEITTIEGVGTPANLHPVQAAFVEFDALQCGFCTPGMIMSVVAALERNPHMEIAEIKKAVAGNICRCGTYPHVFEAALAAAQKMTSSARRRG
ncbi:MAG TPA: (2Fe-2S)-binding protein [Candidatus Binataceae bacterium]|nr:(2Fe-2S)-binding protein [Candidatus Binataceae bacterium]